MDIENRPWKGAKHAKVVIAEWSDFQCPWCSRVNPVFQSIVKKYAQDVKIVWFDFPLRRHPQAMTAAQAAHEVFLQKGSKAFWEFHDKAFANPRALTEQNLAAWAREVGANSAKVTAALKSRKHEKAIRAAMMSGMRIGVRGTPTLIINGKKFRGRRDLKSVTAFVEAEIKTANAAMKQAGIPVAKYYQHIQRNTLTSVKYLPLPPDPSARRAPRRPRRPLRR